MQSEKVIEHIVAWLKNYAEKAGMKGFVIGVSGGIDSAVVSTLAAMTGMKTLVLEMPIRQKEDQVNRAQEHIDFLKNKFPNVDGFRVDLTPTFDTFQSQVDVNDADFPNEQLALANSRSRLRMITLYYYGQIHNLLLPVQEIKLKILVSVFTKYGDGGVDISPIADLVKTQVYEVARHLDIVESIQRQFLQMDYGTKKEPMNNKWELLILNWNGQ
jgi:NAD+ synthase